MTQNDFKNTIKKVQGKREHKVTGSIGVYDIYKIIRKNKWFNIGRPLKEHEFYSIIRSINNYLADNLVNGDDIVFPYGMGRLELRKVNITPKIINGKLIISKPIDWDRTLKLWYNNKEAKDKKLLIKSTPQYIFLIRYNKGNAEYINKSVFTFNISRTVKLLLKDNINKNNTDAFLCGKI